MEPFSFRFGKTRRKVAVHPGTENDRSIAERVAGLVESSNYPLVGNVRFLVYHGTVILQGHCDDTIARAALGSGILSIEGVRRVIDRLTPEMRSSVHRRAA